MGQGTPFDHLRGHDRRPIEATLERISNGGKSAEVRKSCKKEQEGEEEEEFSQMVQKNGHIAEKIHDQFERTNIRGKLRKNIEFMNFCKFILKDRNF